MPKRIEVVAVIGGGAAGMLTALYLQEASEGQARAVVIEPRAGLGRGVAYSTTDPSHVLNVRARCLSARSEDPDHFTDWVQRRTHAGGSSFLPRALYGQYLTSLSEEIAHLQARAVGVASEGGRVRIELASGQRCTADRLVLSVGSTPPAWPVSMGGLEGRAVADPWGDGALDRIHTGRPVVLVGTGLTAVDVALSLRRRGHHSIIAVSRHGLLPSAHSEEPSEPIEIDLPAALTARALFKWARAAAEHAGDWNRLVDGLRPLTDRAWAGLPIDERARLLRHAQRYWEITRHRMAPQVAARIQEMRWQGALEVAPGGIRSIRSGGSGLEVELAHRTVNAGAVINCTGPSRTVAASPDPLVRSLLDRGIVKPGPLGLGLDTDERGCVPGSGDQLWVVGPLRRGHIWETTSMPEIRDQAEQAAQSLCPARQAVSA